MTEPTDAELSELADAHTPNTETGSLNYQTYARAVLAAWGTPPAVAGEPIGYLYCGGSYGDELADWEIVADQHQCDTLCWAVWVMGPSAHGPRQSARAGGSLRRHVG